MHCIEAPAPSALYSTLGGDPDLAELVELFVAEMPERIAKLRAECAQAHWAEVGRTAHQLKGAAGSYGFHQITPIAARLEYHARRDAPVEQIQQTLLELAALSSRLRAGAPGGG